MYDYNGEKFLDKLYSDLYMSDEVQHTKQNTDKRYESIKRYLERLERVHKKANTKTKKELVKSLYYDKYVVKKDELIKIHGNNNEIKNIIDSQKRSLDKWLDYLMDEHSNYPMWAKYWAFQGMLKMGVYDEGIEGYQKRSKDTETPFVDANPEIIAKAISLIEKCISKKEINDEELEKIITSGNFSKIYTILERRYKDNIIEYSTTEGIWIKYNHGSKEDAIKLSKSLQGKNTHWCTVDESMAIRQVCGPYDSSKGGDFYVYYTKDKEGSYTLPRIAMRMNEHDEIGEIRGIEEGQNLEEDLIPILEEKLDEMTFIDDESKEDAFKKIKGLKELTEIYKKTIKREKLTSEELNNLYLEEYGFGWEQDPRVEKTINKRDIIDDYYTAENYNLKVTLLENIIDRIRSDKINVENFCVTDAEVLKNYIINYKTTDILKYASEELKNNKEFMLELVKHNGSALEYAPKELKNDKEIVLEAVRNNGCTLQYASDELKNDKEIVLKAVKNKGIALKYASEELRNDKEVALEAVKSRPHFHCIMSYASMELRNNKEFMLEAVRYNPPVLQYASEELQNDKEVVLEALKDYESVFEYASEELKNDKEFMLEAVRYNAYALQYASEELKNDKEVVLEAVKKDVKFLFHASTELKNNKEFMLEAIKIDVVSIKYASEELKNDKEVVLEAVKYDPASIFVSTKLKNDKEFMLKAIKININSLKYASEELKKDKDIELAAYKKIMETFLSEEIEDRLQIVLDTYTDNQEHRYYHF